MHAFSCVFGPEGVASLYKLREKDASFTEATKGLLSLKLPKEVCPGMLGACKQLSYPFAAALGR